MNGSGIGSYALCLEKELNSVGEIDQHNSLPSDEVVKLNRVFESFEQMRIYALGLGSLSRAFRLALDQALKEIIQLRILVENVHHKIDVAMGVLSARDISVGEISGNLKAYKVPEERSRQTFETVNISSKSALERIDQLYAKADQELATTRETLMVTLESVLHQLRDIVLLSKNSQ